MTNRPSAPTAGPLGAFVLGDSIFYFKRPTPLAKVATEDAAANEVLSAEAVEK